MAWERGKARVQRALSRFLEMPKDIVLDLPKLTMLGNVQLVLENHRGIIEYSETVLRVKVGNGELELGGQNLVLKTILPEELVVEGRINQLQYREVHEA